MGDDNDSGKGTHYLTEEEIEEFKKEFYDFYPMNYSP